MFGVLPIDKPAIRTSRDVCNRIERIVRPDRVGHTGTLDPMATGVLLLAIGSASRLVEFSLGHSKEYEAKFLLGHRSETLDTEGEVIALPHAQPPTRQELQAQAERWTGCVQQVPPKFSAINVAGRRAYELARKGRDFELPAREINIYAIQIMAYDYPQLSLRIDCGSGTYVRSLGSDILRGVGSDAVMSGLVRTRVGPFRLEDCAALEQIETVVDVAERLQPPQHLIANMPSVELTAEQVTNIRNGIPLELDEVAVDRLFAVDSRDELIAVLERVEVRPPANTARYRSLRVFQESNATSQPSSSNKPHRPES
ncbi:MAG: tRNA pseudouridine(55) synthase TruB [Aureliella sp.]